MAQRSEQGTRNAERTRRTILDAATRALADHGGGVALSDIADDAGVSKSGLLHHFPNRDALFLAVAVDALERFRIEVLRFVDLSENRPGKVLRAYVRALCGESEEARKFFAYAGLWHALHMVPGVAERDRAEAKQWAELFAQDGLHPDRILIIRHAAEGFAAASLYDLTVDEDTLRRGGDLLLALTESDGPIRNGE